MRISLPFLAVLTALPATATLAADPAQIERGAYLVRIMDCAGCHMPRNPDGSLIEEAGLSGGNVGFEMPGLGILWPPNLTPDASGLGGWSRDDIATALKTGVRPDGTTLAPVMPWEAYSGLNDQDVKAVAAFLASMKPVPTERLGPAATAAEARAPFYRVILPE
jgi:mono/diheme cytochrome c family protein